MSFNQQLGLRPDGNDVVLDTRPEHEVIPGTVHFAVLATIAEVSAAGAVGASVVPASVNVQLLRRAVPGRLRGRGRLLKRGRRLAFAEGEVYQDDGQNGDEPSKLVAKASVEFAVLG